MVSSSSGFQWSATAATEQGIICWYNRPSSRHHLKFKEFSFDLDLEYLKHQAEVYSFLDGKKSKFMQCNSAR